MPAGGRRAGAGRPKGTTGPQARTIARQEAAAARRRAEADKWLDELERLAYSDLGDYFHPPNNDPAGAGPVNRLRDVHDIPRDARRAVQAIKVTKRNLTAGDGEQEDVVELKLWDKLKALELIGRAEGRFNDKLTLNTDRPLRDRIAAARQRLSAAAKKS